MEGKCKVRNPGMFPDRSAQIVSMGMGKPDLLASSLREGETVSSERLGLGQHYLGKQNTIRKKTLFPHNHLYYDDNRLIVSVHIFEH